MDAQELQSKLDEMFPSGARVCTGISPNSSNQNIFWISRPTVLSDRALLLKPAGLDYVADREFDSVEIDEDRKTVTFSSEGEFFSMDGLFSPVGLEGTISAEREYMDQEWLDIQRSDYAREVEARG